MNAAAQLAAIDAWLADRPAREYVWDERAEQQMSFAAETFDEETGRSRPLGERRTR